MTKRVFLRAAFSLGVLGLALGGSSAKAEFVTGSVSMVADVISSNTNSVLTATVFQFGTTAGGVTTPNTQLTTSGTGTFTPFNQGVVIPSSSLNLTTTPQITLTYGALTFNATSVVINATGPLPNSRAILLNGLITGTGFDATQAQLSIQFNQQGGPGAPIGYSASLSAIPEPASMAMLAMGGLGLLGVARRRKAQTV